jgi:hypothetical protein
LLLIVCILLTFISAAPVSANPGLKVSGAILTADVFPGQTFTHKMTVSIGEDDPGTDIAVEIGDFSQSLNGAYELVETTGNNALSARQFITLDKEAFHLEPGTSQEIKATIHIPQDIGTGGRYAIIKIKTGVSGSAGVGMISSVKVPIALTVKDTSLEHQGEITQFSIEPAGEQSFNISMIFHNTGNHHFRVQEEITFSNSERETVDTVSVPLTATSIIPDMSLQVKTIYKNEGKLTDGIYTVISKVMLENGTVLDEKDSSLEIKGSDDPISTTPQTSISKTTGTVYTLTASSTAILSTTPGEKSVKQTNWPIIGGIVGGVLIVGLLILLLLRRRAQ